MTAESLQDLLVMVNFNSSPRISLKRREEEIVTLEAMRPIIQEEIMAFTALTKMDLEVSLTAPRTEKWHRARTSPMLETVR